VCLGVPGEVIDTFTSDAGIEMGRVSISGIVKDVCLELVPDAEIGEFVIVHVGYAISRIEEKEAVQILELLHEMEAAADLETVAPN